MEDNPGDVTAEAEECLKAFADEVSPFIQYFNINLFKSIMKVEKLRSELEISNKLLTINYPLQSHKKKLNGDNDNVIEDDYDYEISLASISKDDQRRKSSVPRLNLQRNSKYKVVQPMHSDDDDMIVPRAVDNIAFSLGLGKENHFNQLAENDSLQSSLLTNNVVDEKESIMNNLTKSKRYSQSGGDDEYDNEVFDD
jgi:hypothetical protein